CGKRPRVDLTQFLQCVQQFLWGEDVRGSWRRQRRQ
ncbi:PTRH1 isoform 9, partial [Pan troglodytes]